MCIEGVRSSGLRVNHRFEARLFEFVVGIDKRQVNQAVDKWEPVKSVVTLLSFRRN